MKKVVVLTGAGMSVESGFSTFRGNNGMWENYKVEDVATHTAWVNHPDFVNAFYNKMRLQLLDAQPNRGHFLLAEMEQEFDLRIITQNIDNLHEKAGSTRVLHLHGELMKVTSSVDPDNPLYIRELDRSNYSVHSGELAADGSLLRPYIVFFEEAVPNISLAAEWVSQSEVFIIIGASLVVYPAAGLLSYTSPDTTVFVIDPNPVDIDSSRKVHIIPKTASEGLDTVLNILRYS